ncbi:Aldo/keto reductase [Amylostereum chailletii]|nr:Aldo/keto reductase [Amylostereum chailletii]
MTATSEPIPTYTLNNGVTMPSVGLGCWMGSPGGGERTHAMVLKALKLTDLYLSRRSMRDKVVEGLEQSLVRLGVDYVDLYLIHWPQVLRNGVNLQPEERPTVVDTWRDMEKLLKVGKVRSIGVANFSVKTLNQLLPHCEIIPSVNQVEMHPCLPQEDLRHLCDKKGIRIIAYSPLGQPSSSMNKDEKPSLLEDASVQSIATKNNITPAQALLSWGVQRGTGIIPKTEDEARMRSNITLVTLDEEDMKTLNELHKKPGMHRSLFFTKDTDKVAGWTYDQLGWNRVAGGFVPGSLR